MSGLGRRTHYRKHLTDSVWNDFPEPGENELIVKVMASRGSNQFDICLPSAVVLDPPQYQLAILPTKFNKLVWIKRNDFVIVRHGNDDDNNSGIRFMIQNILYKEQVKHLKAENLWPHEFTDDLDDKDITEVEVGGIIPKENRVPANDGIVYDQGYDIEDELFMMNTNRIAALKIDDDSSCSSDDKDIINGTMEDNGISYDQGYNMLDDMLTINTNQRTFPKVDEDSSCSSEDEDVGVIPNKNMEPNDANKQGQHIHDNTVSKSVTVLNDNDSNEPENQVRIAVDLSSSAESYSQDSKEEEHFGTDESSLADNKVEDESSESATTRGNNTPEGLMKESPLLPGDELSSNVIVPNSSEKATNASSIIGDGNAVLQSDDNSKKDVVESQGDELPM